MRERDIERYLVQRVKALGGEVRKVQWVGRRGAPDRVVMLPPLPELREETLCGQKVRWRRIFPSPTTVWVELKAPGKKPEAHQHREHERMRRMGQRVEVIDSLEGVDKLLR